ncbi:MAG: trigger factor [Flavobacterium sp.]|nr:MAG: trigger factor [Flavobacterium sp.]
MNITRKDIDKLNAVVTVEITKEDYEPKVEKMLGDYRKNANIPGFRKGTVPMSLIRKQYGKAILLEEVNKLLQENLNKYIQDENIDILGNPLPKMSSDFNWDDETLKFDFELGLTPKFDVDLAAANDVKLYRIIADDKMLDDQIGRIRKQYGKLVSQNEVTSESDLTGTFSNEEKGINNTTTFALSSLSGQSEKFIGKKVGDVVTVNTKGLFEDDHKLMDLLNVGHDDVHGLDVDINFTIEEVNTSEPAELNQELFDKLFGEGVISSAEELKAKIKEDAEKQFAVQADQRFLNDVTESLLKNTQFELPGDFLKKWIQTAGETTLSPEEAATEYEKSENGLRYQLIEGKVITENNLQITFDDLKAFTSDMIRKQMAQFGQMNPSDSDVEGIVARVLSNQEEVKRLSEQVMSSKMLSLFKEKVAAEKKEVSYDQFVKDMYGE